MTTFSPVVDRPLVAPEVQDILANFDQERLTNFIKGLSLGSAFRFLNGSANMPVAAGLPVVAETTVQVACDEHQAVLLMKALHDSDVRLASRELSDMHWDWEFSTVEPTSDGLYLVRFGVVWHKRWFYYIRRDAWLDEFHQRQYSHLNLGLEQFQVRNLVIDSDPTRVVANWLARWIPYQSKGTCPFFRILNK